MALAIAAVVVALLLARQGLETQWLTVSYDDLIDRSQLTHSGVTVGEMLLELASENEARGEVQPFLEPFAGYLLDVHEMSVGPSSPPLEAVSQTPQQDAGASQ